MTALLRVVSEKNRPTRYAGHAHFALHGVLIVDDVLMTVSMRKHLAWICFVRIVGSAKTGRLEGTLLHLLFSMNRLVASVFRARYW